MARFLSTILLIFLTKIALSNDIFMDLSFPDKSDKQPAAFENTAYINPKDMAHHLLNTVGEHLLSNNEGNNILAQILIQEQKDLETLKKSLEILLKPFVEQDPKLKPEVNLFITKVVNTIRNMNSKTNLSWENIKAILPTIQIFCKQLIDRVANF